MERIGQHAIVIGASLGGLLAARAVAGAYDRVTVLERDELPQEGQPRKGVPQGRHAHGLLARGREVMEDFFPGLTQELVAQGALCGDITRQVRWFNQGAYHCRFDSGLEGLAVSRPALETHIRNRLVGLPNVRICERVDVLGLLTTADRTRVTGVRLAAQGTGDGEDSLAADLVIDATGRGSRMPAWLEHVGYTRPAEDRIEIGVTYGSRFYRRNSEDLDGDRAIVLAPMPPSKRTGFVIAQEGDRWIVTLVGYLGEQVPTEEDGFLDFARSLPTPDIYDLIARAEPLTDVASHKFPSNQRRWYETLPRFPEGLLVIGDAICSFNPVYGQGMTVAALDALTLAECLAAGTDRLRERFFRRVAKVVDIPWSIAVGTDLRFAEVRAPRSAMVRFINWYVGKVHVAAWHDPAVALAFQHVANLKAPPPTLLRLPVAARVLRENVRPRGIRARSVAAARMPRPTSAVTTN